MQTTIQEKGQVKIAIITPAGSMTSHMFYEELDRVFKDMINQDIIKVIVDLKNVGQITAPGLGQLIGWHNAFAKHGGRMLLINVNRPITHLFLITKLSLIFEIMENMEAAIQAI